MQKTKLYKGSLSTIILKLLSDNDRMYGYEMTQKVKTMTKGELKITEGALYPALHKLEAQGLIEVEMQKVDNRLRKYYRLTQKGNEEKTSMLSELEAYLQTMQSILNSKPSLS